jgi:hypothetical protein
MPFDQTAVALIDLEDAAAALGVPSQFARTYLESRGEIPVASYHGRPLWLSDTVHAIVGTEARPV